MVPKRIAQGALAAMAALAVFRAMVGWVDWTDPGIQRVTVQALIAGTVIVSGWAVNNWLVRRRDQNLRDLKTMDMMCAIRAEIRTFAEGQQNRDLGKVRQRGLDLFADEQSAAAPNGSVPDEKRFVPVFVMERHSQVFDAQVGEIHVLPTQAVESVVLFYTQLRNLTEMLEEVRADDFGERPRITRERMFKTYMDMRVEAKRLSDRAILVLNGQVEALERRARQARP